MKNRGLGLLFFTFIIGVVGTVVLSVPMGAESPEPWRSALYPDDWTPCYADEVGRFIQDFSFAGYHGGMRSLPEEGLEPIFDVTEAPYGADPTGEKDATAAIQKALDDAGRGGGGTVYLPPGTYLLSVGENDDYALGITHSHVRLVGAGPDETFLYVETTDMREKDVLRVYGAGRWRRSVSGVQYISEPLVYPTQIIPLDGPPRFDVGDWVVVTHDTTDEWIADHNMDDMWAAGSLPGAVMYRQIIDVDTGRNTITVDAPIRYYLLPRDKARVYRVSPHIEEVGISDFSIGMAEHPGFGWGEEDYKVPGTGGYAVHSTHAIRLLHVVNAWIRNVHSYKPDGNERAHLLSNGIAIRESRFVTVDSVDLKEPQYRGSGGNGYLYTLFGNDSLIVNSSAYNGRHNYDFKQGYANGNVITDSYASSPDSRNSDFHMHLSPSNLIDDMFLDEERFDAGWHGSFGGVPHALTTTKSVLWNIHGERYKRNLQEIVYTEQYGWGYVIGTRGPAHRVLLAKDHRYVRDGERLRRIDNVNHRTLPADYVEGEGRADGLQPQSLYEDQLRRRIQRDHIIHCPQLDFRPPVPRISIRNPQTNDVVRGDLTLDIDVKAPLEQVSIEKIAVSLDEETIYRGGDVPETLTIETERIPDGRRRITVDATADNGLHARQSVSFSVSNRWRFSDYFLAPLESGLFGTVPREKTVDASSGWTYDTSDPDLFFGDESRRVRLEDREAFLIWNASALRELTITVYSPLPSVAKFFRLDVLEKGGHMEESGSWHGVHISEEVVDESEHGLYKFELKGEVDAAIVSELLRLTLRKGSGDGFLIQLGEIDLIGRNL